MPLTPKEEKFCQAYVVKLDKAKAAVAAGYSKKTAGQIGYENFTKPHILDRIQQIRDEIKERLGIDDHSVITKLAALSYWNIKDFVSEGNKIKDISNLSRSKLTPIVGIKSSTSVTKVGEMTLEKVDTEIKFVDKRASIIDLGRHLGIFEKDNKQKAMKIKVTRK